MNCWDAPQIQTVAVRLDVMTELYEVKDVVIQISTITAWKQS